MAQFSLTLTGQWTDVYAVTGLRLEDPLLLYADGGNFAAAYSVSEPTNLAYGAEAKQGEQLSAGGDGATKVWVRATSGGHAIIRVQDEEVGSVRKDAMGGMAKILDDVEIKDIQAIQVVSSNASQFGETIVAARTPVIELNSSYGQSALRDLTEVTGSGTVTDGLGIIEISTGATASSSALLQSSEIGRYMPGYGAQMGIGIRLNALPTGNQTARWGGAGPDELNSFRFGVDATGIFVSVVRAGVETHKTYQADWNIDKLDGTGLSDVNIDLTDGIIFQIDFTWYGYGEIKWGVIASTIDKFGVSRQRFIPCHQHRPSGAVSTNSPNFRVYAVVDNGGDAADLTVDVGGRQYSIIGQYEAKYRFSSDYRGSVSTGTTAVPLISAQRKSAFSDRSVKLAGVEAIAGNAAHILEVRIDGTLTGESFGAPTDHTAAETAMEYDTSATAITGGIVIGQILVPAGGGAGRILGTEKYDLDIPNGKIITLCAKTFTGTSTVANSLMQLREEW